MYLSGGWSAVERDDYNLLHIMGHPAKVGGRVIVQLTYRPHKQNNDY